MVDLEPVTDEPAAVTTLDEETVLVIADYHAGIEIALREAGVELDSHAAERREHLLTLVERTDADELLVVGDLGHTVGEPESAELAELEDLVAALPVPMTLVPGNHDAGLGSALDISVADTDGLRRAEVGFVHGHSWPAAQILSAPMVCMGHEHPMVRLEDEVGGSHVERVWLRGELELAPFREHGVETEVPGPTELVVVPAFNTRSGGTWVNVPDQTFLSPFLPAALPNGRAYLLDGTDLGGFQSV